MLRYDSFQGGGGGTVPVPAVDPYWANVELLCGFDGADGSTSLVDEGPDGRTVTANGNAQVDTAQFKFGTGSLLLDGAGDFASVAHDSVFSVASGDFTLEGFFRLNELGRTQAFINKRDSSSAEEFSLYLLSTNDVLFNLFAGVAVLSLTSVSTLTTGPWYHLAAARQGTTSKLFIDGNEEASGVQSGTPSTNTAPVKIGRDGFNTSRDFSGQVDEIRFTKGVARYTGSFTPPSAAFPRS